MLEVLPYALLNFVSQKFCVFLIRFMGTALKSPQFAARIEAQPGGGARVGMLAAIIHCTCTPLPTLLCRDCGVAREGVMAWVRMRLACARGASTGSWTPPPPTPPPCRCVSGD